MWYSSDFKFRLVQTTISNSLQHTVSRSVVWMSLKGSFTLTAAVCGFRSGLRQCIDRNFSISAEQRNRLPQTHAENAVMWMSLKLSHFQCNLNMLLLIIWTMSNFCIQSHDQNDQRQCFNTILAKNKLKFGLEWGLRV